MIKFSNGYVFKYMAASGALGFDGKGWSWERPLRWLKILDPSLFTIVTKTLTLNPARGNFSRLNPFRCVRLIDGGVVNAVSLSNPGFAWWSEEVGPEIDSKKISLVASIFGEPDELAVMARRLNEFDLVALEINSSCPNVGVCDVEKIIEGCAAAKESSRLPLILKISVAQDIPRIVKGTKNLVEAYSINSVPWATVFPRRRSPLEEFGGGAVSGKAAQPFTWSLAEQISVLSDVPVIWPGMWDYEDLEKARNKGAQAVSFGSVFLRYPWRPTLYVRKDKKLR